MRGGRGVPAAALVILALGYAARHPGRFSAAASISGIVHTRLSEAVTQNYRTTGSTGSANSTALGRC